MAKIHVMMRERQWAVVREGSVRSESTHDRLDDAIKIARALAERDGSSVVVLGYDGRPKRREDDEPAGE